MDKEELLKELSEKISAGEIRREEVVHRLGLPSTTRQEHEGEKLSSFSFTKVLYILGAAIVIIGIIIYIAQIWNDIGGFARIAITLGLGLLTTLTGSVLSKQRRGDKIGPLFHVIGGALIPGGAVVTLSELSVNIVSLWTMAITFGVIFVFYLLLNLTHKHFVLTFFTIVHGTAFIYLLVGAIIDGPFYRNGDIYAYLTMVIGASYLLLARSFREGWNNTLVGALYFFGIAGLLGAGFSQVFDSILWQMFYFLMVIGGIFLSTYMKSRSILIVSTLFLIAHISYITSEYFANSVGWPISLVILGFIFIGLGYVSITINKKYIQKA